MKILMVKLRATVFGLMYFVFNRIELRYLGPMGALSNLNERMRVISLSLLGCRIGRDSYIRSRSFITNPSKVEIGNFSKIGPNCELWSYGGITIGNNVEIGSHLIIHTDEHIISDKELPLAKQGSEYEEVVIGDDVYIGSRVTILSGVSIGNRVVVASGAVVIDDLSDGYLYAGIPAIKKKKLFS